MKIELEKQELLSGVNTVLRAIDDESVTIY